MLGIACRDNLAVWLNCNGRSHILMLEEIGSLLSAGAKGLVEGSIRVVACQREISCGTVTAVVGKTYEDNLPVRLNCNAFSLIVMPEEISGLLSTNAKGRVKIACCLRAFA